MTVPEGETAPLKTTEKTRLAPSTTTVTTAPGLGLPVEIGSVPTPSDLEYSEFLQYQDGTADKAAAEVPGEFSEPWQNVVAAFEPGSRPQMEQLLGHPRHAARVRGKVLDLAAGTCWATARLSRVPAVEEVTAIDLSPAFLGSVGNRMLEIEKAQPEKIRLLASTFERVPRPDASFDAAFMIAAIHHALAPIRVLREARRLLKSDGALFVFESPPLTWHLGKARRNGLDVSRSTRTTEIAYSRGELEYLFRCGGFVVEDALESEGLSPRWPQRWIRRGLRALGIERHLLVIGYVFVLRPDPDPIFQQHTSPSPPAQE